MKNSKLKKIIKEVLNEAVEPELVQVAKRILKNKQYEKFKCPKTGKKTDIDMQTANAIVTVYDSVNSTNKKRFMAPVEKFGLKPFLGFIWKSVSGK